MLELFSYEFVRNALIAGVLASVLCAVLGTFIIVKRLVFISGGISHSAFGGLGLFYYLGLNPIAGAFVAAGISALILGLVSTRKMIAQDALIGVIWATGMAAGILFISLSPGYAPNLMTYLFGNILAITRSDVYLSIAVTFSVLAVVALLYKEFVAIAFDEEFAYIQGVPVRILMILFMVLIGFTIVLLIRLVGIILVIALLTIPPMIVMQLFRRFTQILLFSSLVSIVMTVGGLMISYQLDLPSGPVIIIFGAILLSFAFLGRKFADMQN